MTCPSCNGLGHDERTGALCRACNGSGVVSSDPMLLTPDEIQLAALQQRVRELEAALSTAEALRRSVVTAVLHEVGGTVEGRPTSPVNYLQRLRELVQTEAQVEKNRDWMARRGQDVVVAQAQVAALRKSLEETLGIVEILTMGGELLTAARVAVDTDKRLHIADRARTVLAAPPAPKVDPYDTGTVGSGRKHWRLPDEPKPKHAPTCRFGYRRLESDCDCGLRKRPDEPAPCPECAAGNAHTVTVNCEPAPKPDRTHSLEDGCPGGHREPEPDHVCNLGCRDGWLAPEAVARVREAISHALLNAKWITGGDERRLKEALALLPEVKP